MKDCILSLNFAYFLSLPVENPFMRHGAKYVFSKIVIEFFINFKSCYTWTNRELKWPSE